MIAPESHPELFVVLTSDGRGWASAEPVEGIFPYTVVHPIRPGEAIEEVPYEAWHAVIGETVDLETLRHEFRRGRLPQPAQEASSSTTVASDPATVRRRLRGSILVFIAVLIAAAARGGLVTQVEMFATYRPVNALVIDAAVGSEAVNNRTWYRPIVRYQYEVAGMRYEGSRFSWRPSAYGDSLEAIGMLAPYEPGQRVTVYVHPDDVSRSFLRRDGGEVIVAAAVVMLGLLVLLYRFFVARNYGA